MIRLKIVNVTFYREDKYVIMTDKVIYKNIKDLTAHIDGKMEILKQAKTYSVEAVKGIDVDIILI